MTLLKTPDHPFLMRFSIFIRGFVLSVGPSVRCKLIQAILSKGYPLGYFFTFTVKRELKACNMPNNCIALEVDSINDTFQEVL